MKIADLYVRVSSDEQARGYSLRSQEELLRRYCEINNISVRDVVIEDHSAKSFNRPAWKQYLSNLRRHKGKTDLVLFLKWDRFSRNAGDAYQMINTLRKLGVEPQAVEQPLDIAVPENQMMLAFYLAAPQVENERRALNVIDGMRRARKEGRYMGLAPIGYINHTDEAGKKSIIPKEPEAGIVRWAFEEIAKGVFNTEQIFKMAKEKGFRRTRSLFWFVIRNPVYCGKIFLPKYKGDEARFVKASHEPLISEALFYDVQDVLDGRKRRQYRPKIVSNVLLPLRGFLICPLCGKLLSGSTSKGHTKRYSYYHCFGGCTCRFRADMVNDIFLNELKTYIPRQEMAEVYQILLIEEWHDQTGHIKNGKKELLAQIKELEERISYARDLLSSRKIEPDDFREMKTEYTCKLERLEAKLNACSHDEVDIKHLLSTGISNLLKLDYIFTEGDIEQKRELISSMYPENLTFDGFRLRTSRINEAVRLIYLIDNKLGGNKKGQSGNESALSCQVGMAGFEPTTSSTPCWRDTWLRYIPIG
jgi:site-specific DNA recombinase